MFSLADSNFNYLSFFMNTGPALYVFCGASGVVPLMNSFNNTEAAICPMQDMCP